MGRKYLAKLECESTDERDRIERVMKNPEIRSFLTIIGDPRITEPVFMKMMDGVGRATREALLEALTPANPD